MVNVSYGIAKCIREITRGSAMCRYLTTNELIYDRMNTVYNKSESIDIVQHYKIIKKSKASCYSIHRL